MSETSVRTVSDRPGVDDVLPLTPLQEGLLFHALYDAEGPDVYTVQLDVEMTGPVDAAALRRAGQALLDRHAALRVGFRHQGVDRPVAVVRRGVRLPFREVVLEGADAEARSADLVAAQRATRFVMHHAPLLRMLLIRTPGGRARMVLTVHHILLDGWSYPVLLEELFVHYEGGASALAPARPFREHLEWLARQDRAAAVEAHTRALDDVPGPTLLSRLGRRDPASPPRPATETVELSDDLTHRLAALSRTRGWTTNTMMRTCWALVLGAALDRTDVTFGATVSGRPAELPGVERMVGLFINTLPVRVRWRWDEHLDDLVDRVQAEQAQLLDHQHVPLSDVLEAAGTAELFDTSTVFENYPVDVDSTPPLSDGVRITDVAARDSTHYTLGLAGLPGQRLAYRLTYRSDILDAALAARLADMLRRTLTQLAEQPRTVLAHVRPAAEEDRPREVVDGGPVAPVPSVTTLIHEQAVRVPGAPAIRDRDGVLDAAAVQRAAGVLAARLVEAGAGPEERVATALPRGADAVVAVLAVLRSGAAWVPVDPDAAPARTRTVLASAAPRITLTAGPLDLGPDAGAVLDVAGCARPADDRGPGGVPDDIPQRCPEPHADTAAYVIHTSGSTGAPKGVVVPHRALAHYMCWLVDAAPSLRVGALLHGPLTVDGTLPSLLGPLVAGGCVVVGELAEGDTVPGGLLKVTPSHLALLDALGPDLDPGAELLVGGEALPVAALRARPLTHDGPRVLAEYGPTETTVAATALEVPVPGREAGHGTDGADDTDGTGMADVVALGRPLPGVRLALLDSALRDVPRGTVGEVYLAGVGLARGYLGRADLTAARFVADPHGPPGSRLYRSGDLARWDDSWNLRFVGRADDQVKIRGHRVEPGEVEATLAVHPLVARCAVLAVASGEDVELIGYAVPAPGGSLDAAAVLDDLRSRLPDPMVPSALVEIEELPLTAGGKVDRRALPDPPATRGGTGRHPDTYAERVLAGLFVELLPAGNGREVRADDDFFDLGGNSLLATRLVSRIRSALDVEVGVRAVFDAPTVADLGRVVGGAAPGRRPIRPRPRPERVPLSSAQRRLWFLEQLGDDPAAYLLPLALRLRPHGSTPVDRERLLEAWGAVLERHEALRTRFPDDHGEPWQDVLAPDRARDALRTAFEQVTTTPAELAATLAAQARRPLPLATGLPLRLVLVTVEGADPVLLVVLHHIVGDGWSWSPLLRDLAHAWDDGGRGSGSAGPVFAEPLPVQYADYALWQEQVLEGEGVLAEQVGYWTAQLGDLPATLPLPTDGTRVPGVTAGAGHVDVVLDAAMHARLDTLAREHRVSVFMVLQAALAALLTRHGAGSDVPLGTVTSGRTDGAVEDLVGFFVNTLVLRTDTSGDPTFAELLARVRTTDLAAFAHQDLPFERVVELVNPPRVMGRHPLFQILLALTDDEGVGSSATWGDDLEVAEEPVELTATKFDLLVDLSTTRAPDGSAAGIRGRLHYARDLFSAATAHALTDRLSVLLDALVADPATRIGAPDLRSDAERDRTRAERDAARVPRPGAALTDLFASRVASGPATPAVTGHGRHLTAAELDAASARLARVLRARGVVAETVVGVAVARTPDLLVALWGILRAGGAYLPLDTDLPAERLALLIDDARPALVVTDRADALPGACATPVVDVDEPVDVAGPGLPDGVALPARHPDQLAYVIYTSGSTGRPKGVEVHDRAVVNLVLWAGEFFDTDERAAVLGSSSAGFDVSVFELFAPLLTGGRIELVDRLTTLVDTAPGPVTMICGVPSVTAEVVDSGARLVARSVLLAGEGLSTATYDRIRAGTTAREVVNLYGPTETTVYCTGRRVTAAPGELSVPGVPIGAPLANTVIHLLDDRLVPVPTGVIGEIHVAGACVTRGYRGAPQVTAGRYVADPFGPAGGRMYRTGDLARRDHDGELYHEGRVDDQVKIRGVRIEPGEVAAVLAAHPAVGDAVVVPGPDTRGDTALVGYLVPVAGAAPDTVDTEDVDRWAGGRLPGTMRPATLVVIERLPLGANGKLDVRALPAPAVATVGTRAPAGPVEEQVCAVFADVLAAPVPGPDSDFFALGGHSLLVTKLVGRLRAAYDVELAVRTVFADPTPAGIARALATAPAARPALRPGSGSDELSYAQRRLWFLEHLDRRDRAAGSYHVRIALRIDGDLSLPALHAALRDVLSRHPVLRTSYPDVEGRPRALRHSERDADALLGELVVRPLDARRGAAEVAAAADARFDLAHELPLRVRCWATGADTHLLLVVVHHIAVDGWSLDPLLRDLGSAYRARAAGDTPRWAPLPVDHADHVDWSHRVLGDESDPDSAMAGHLAYWQDRLAGLPDVLDLPTDRPRPADPSHESGLARFTVPAPVRAGLEAVASAHRSSTFVVLHAALAALFTRLGAGTDVVLGTAVAGRGDPLLDEVVGLFVNTVVLRTDTSGDPTFATVVDRARESDLEAFAHQEMPFDRLVEVLAPQRALGRHPIFTVMLVLQNTVAPEIDLGPGTSVSEADLDPGPAKFDLSIDLTPVGDELEAQVVFARDLFDDATVTRLCARWVALLASACAAPDRPLSALEVFLPGERAELRAAAHGAPAVNPPATVPARFAAVAAADPDAVAVRDGAGHGDLTYGALAARVGRWAGALRAAGVGPESRVALLMSRSADLATAMLAVLTAGGAYVPLHDAQPVERHNLLLARTDAHVLVTDREPPPELVGPSHVLDPAALDAAPEDPSAAPGSGSDRPDRLASVMFTSGSTGEPKGVAVTHANLVALVDDRMFDAPAHRRVLWASSPGFDAASYELWVPLLRGGTVVVGPVDGLDPAAVRRTVGEDGVTAAWLTAGLFRVLAHEDPASLQGLAELWVGGDVVPADAVERVRASCPDLRVVNGYGPTETTVFACRGPVDTGTDAGSTVPIGRPMDATAVHLLDGCLQPVPPGAVGEIYLGGSGTTRGYLGRAGHTAERFVADPTGPTGARLYRTGDRARRLPDGRVDFLGRVDDQVKLRGFRVEPGEVEAVAVEHHEVDSAVVLVRDTTGAAVLVGHVVATGPGELDLDGLRAHLVARLPDHMVPTHLIPTPSWPLTPNGKIDRAALHAMPLPDLDPAEGSGAGSGSDGGPRTDTEHALRAVVADVLGVTPDAIGSDTGFFALGGDSITSIQLVARARAAGWELTPREVFVHQSVRGLAAVARGTAQAHPPSAAPSAPAVVGLPPIAAWLLEGGGPLLGFHQHRVLVAPPDLTHEHLCRAVGALLARHDALRMRLVEDGPRLEFRAEVTPEEAVLRWDGADEDTVRAAHEQARDALDPYRGAMVRVAWCDAGPERPGRLVVAVHHLAVDAVSWSVLVPDLVAAVRAAAAGHVALPPPRTPYAAWAAALAAAADDPRWSAQRAHWLSVLAHGAPDLGPATLDPRRDVLDTAERHVVELGAEQTATLVRDAPAVFGAAIPDLLCSSFALALREWQRRRGRTASGPVLLDIEGHGRHGDTLGAPGEVLDLSETVGWCTVLHPVAVEAPDPAWADVLAGGPALGVALKAAKESLRAVPDHGIGFGLLRYGPRPDPALVAADVPRPALNYLGRTTGDGGSGHGASAAPWAPVGEAVEVAGVDGAMPFAHPLEVLAALRALPGREETLTIELTWPAALLARDDAAELAELWLAALRAHAAHLADAEGGLTPSDLSSVTLSQFQIDDLTARLRGQEGFS